MTVFRGLIEDYPELPEPYNNLAVLLAQRGEYDNAKVALETAIRTAPDWSVPHENLGRHLRPPRRARVRARGEARQDQQDRSGEARDGARSSRERGAAQAEELAFASPSFNRRGVDRCCAVPFLIAALLLAAIFAVPAFAANPQVEFDTTAGKIKIELYPDAAPKTVANFLDYVKAKHYDGTQFHRVIPAS
jgi:hypothetical protein